MGIQWLRLCTPNAGGWGSIPGQGTRSQRLQRRSKTSCATAETQHGKIHNKSTLKKEKNQESGQDPGMAKAQIFASEELQSSGEDRPIKR